MIKFEPTKLAHEKRDFNITEVGRYKCRHCHYIHTSKVLEGRFGAITRAVEAL